MTELPRTEEGQRAVPPTAAEMGRAPKQTVREQMAEALETMIPLLQSFDNWCRVDRLGLCQSHFGEEHCSVVAARRAFNAALDRHRAEPEEPCTAACDMPTEAHCTDCPCVAAYKASLEGMRE